jgi:hypothetical protein
MVPDRCGEIGTKLGTEAMQVKPFEIGVALRLNSRMMGIISISDRRLAGKPGFFFPLGRQ